MNLPLISLAITCYNAQDTIERALRSALAQTWSNTEVLVVDDCSTDESWAILQSISTQHPAIRLLRAETNAGVGAARRRLVEEARGEFIAFFDDDDESVPCRIQLQYERIRRFEISNAGKEALCYGGLLIESRSGKTIARGMGWREPEPHGDIAANYLLGIGRGDRYSWGTWGSLVLLARREYIRRIGNFDAAFRRTEDRELAVRAALDGAYFISVDEPIIFQYLTESADKAGYTILRFQIRMLRKYKAYLKTHKAYLGAIANMHATFHHTNGRHWRGWLWRVLALLLFPWSLSKSWLSGRSGRRTQ